MESMQRQIEDYMRRRLGDFASDPNAGRVRAQLAALRRGVGRKLFETALSGSSSETITVNSSAFAVGIYRRLGFTAVAEEQTSNGLRYTPMIYKNKNSG